MKKQLSLILILLTLSSCVHKPTCVLKPGVESNPQAKTIEDMVMPKGIIQCDF
jgi:hypothetical protein